MPTTVETGHRSFASPVDAEQVGRAMLGDATATETQLLATAAAMRGTSVGGHNRAARIRHVADQLEARALARMRKRAVRAAVRDHARIDPQWRGEQARRTVDEALTDAETLGLASRNDPGFERHRDEYVFRVRYAETWRADYAVAPDGSAVCWQD